MTLEHIRITFLPGEGTLRRVLGLIEARGFNIRSMQMGSDLDQCTMTIALDPRDGTRRTATLIRQIQRLHMVIEASELSNAPPIIEVRHAAVA